MPICCKLKQISLKSDFIHIFSCFYTHIYPEGRGRQPWGQKSDVNRKALSLCPFVASFKTISMTSDIIHISNDFIHVYSPRAGTDNPLRTKF